MKNVMRILLLGLLLHNSTSFAQCSDLLVKLQGKLNLGEKVAVTTTHSKQGATFALTFGNLEADPSRAGGMISHSVRSEFKNPDNTATSLATIEIFGNGTPTSAQLNYKINDDAAQSTGYLMTCNKDMMYIHASDGILTAMFQTLP